MSLKILICLKKKLNEIYHPSLLIEKTNYRLNETNILDINIKISNKRINFGIYNKTDDYNFKINRYPKWLSNIPRCIITNTFASEVLRIYRNCSNYTDFRSRIIELSKTSAHNGWSSNRIVEVLHRTFLSKPYILRKYGFDMAVTWPLLQEVHNMTNG